MVGTSPMKSDLTEARPGRPSGGLCLWIRLRSTEQRPRPSKLIQRTVVGVYASMGSDKVFNDSPKIDSENGT